VKRVQLPAKEGNCAAVDASALPAITRAYLEQAYPNYVFEKAFRVQWNGTVQGYVVVIDANNTKYAIAFDASGNFLKVKTIS